MLWLYGQSIQQAVKQAKSGDVIHVYPGTYHETVYIDKDSISLTGVIVNGEWPTLDGQGKLNDAISYSGNNVRTDFLVNDTGKQIAIAVMEYMGMKKKPKLRTVPQIVAKWMSGATKRPKWNRF